MSKKDFHQRCNACDFQKLKEVENNPAVRRLRDQIEQLTFRLSECRNENQMLKRDLQLAKKMVCQEVGEEDVDFQKLLKHGTESGSKGRQEDVLLLKNKVQELKDYLREIEGGEESVAPSPSEEYVKNQMPKDAKKLWRMELERRLAREEADKDMDPLMSECVELRRRLDAEKSRFRELTEETKLLKAELKTQQEKSQQDFGIVASLKTVETQLQETLAERAEIRKELAGSRSRNRRLSDEIRILREELKKLQSKTEEESKLIDSLTASHKSLQEAIDSEKKIVQQNQERYREELKALHEEHGEDLLILDHLQNIVGERNDLVEQLQQENKQIEEKKQNSQVKKSSSKDVESKKSSSKEAQPLDATESKSKESVDPEKEGKIKELRLECALYKALCAAAKQEGERLATLVEEQETKLNEIAVQVVEAGRLIMMKNAEKKELSDKVSRMQRASTATKKRRGGASAIQPRNRLEELRIKADAQREENAFLRNFLRTAVCSKAKDLQVLKSYLEDAKAVLKAAKSEIEQALAPPSETSEDDTEGESRDETDN